MCQEKPPGSMGWVASAVYPPGVIATSRHTEIFQQHLPDFTATLWEVLKLLCFCFESKALINADAFKSISGITRSQH